MNKDIGISKVGFRILIFLCLPILLGGRGIQAVPVNAAISDSTERRIALVIGNADYKSAPLANPIHDSRAIARKLRTLGFDTIERANLTRREAAAALAEFGAKLRPGAIALFFYAGHGVQINGENYFPLVDSEMTSEQDILNYAVKLDKVLGLMAEARTQVNLVFLDACRNNPFSNNRSLSRGLAPVSAPSGTIISFATAPGKVASDGGAAKNGLYTKHLLDNMARANEGTVQMLLRVFKAVKEESEGRQEPWFQAAIDADFCFNSESSCGLRAIPPPPPVMTATMSGTWRSPAYPKASYLINQQGLTLYVQEISHEGGGRTVTAEGTGQLEGRMVTVTMKSMYGVVGTLVLTLSDDKRSMSGTYSTEQESRILTLTRPAK